MDIEGRTIILSTPEDLFPLIIEAVRAAQGRAEKTPDEMSDTQKSTKKLLTPKEIETQFGIHRKMLAYWRMEGIGPTYITFGRRIFYERAVFEEFVLSGRIETTGYVS